MIRAALIEQIRRQIYNGYVSDDATITEGLVNQYIEQGIAVAAKKNYTDAIQLDGVGYVNNSFYSTFKGISVSKDENFLWKLSLPQIPVGIGKNEGVANLRFKSSDGQVSLDCIPLSINQQGFNATMRVIPNKTLYYSEGGFLYILSTILLNAYSATVTMISGGDATDMDSILNVPSDYIPVIIEYVKSQLAFEKSQPQDVSNDGLDKA